MEGIGAKFDLQKRRVFDNEILNGLQKTMALTLQASDRAFYQAAFNSSIESQMKAAKVKQPTTDMLEIAHLDGLYRTFNDDNALSRSFVTIKKAMNGMTGSKDFGLGDLALKFPRTPANILMRGIEYSPAGFALTTKELVTPLIGRKFDQKHFVEATSRALVGSSLLVGTGAILGQLGIITGRRDKDKDVAAFLKAVGEGDYRINISALKRFYLSGMNPELAQSKAGDTFVTYDCFQPAAINLAIALIILVVTVIASRWISGITRRTLSRVRGFRHDQTVLSFVVQVVRVVVLPFSSPSVKRRPSRTWTTPGATSVAAG